MVGSRWVLTAAHCVRRKLFVRLAEHDLAIREGPEIEYKVSYLLLGGVFKRGCGLSNLMTITVKLVSLK